MILYTDTSALVKKYVREAGSDQVQVLFAQYPAIGTAALTQVEMAAALAKAVRLGWVDGAAMLPVWQDFLSHWGAYTRLPVSSGIIERAATLVWQHGLRAYDAIHLASALVWREAMGEEMTFACYDKVLQRAARAEGLAVWPEE